MLIAVLCGHFNGLNPAVPAEISLYQMLCCDTADARIVWRKQICPLQFFNTVFNWKLKLMN